MSLLGKFLGTGRWIALTSKLSSESSRELAPKVDAAAVMAAVMVALTPVLLTVICAHAPPQESSALCGILPTVGFGVCTVLAVLVRWRLDLPFTRTGDWRSALSLTHTAVALGCIPAVLIVLIDPELLAQRHELLTDAMQAGERPDGPRPELLSIVLTIVLISGWVAVVEEILFRGLLVSVLRRCNLFGSQVKRDILAGSSSALIFGFAHYATWGPFAALALVGLGAGFVLAYIATGEKLVPVIIYHFIFDILSISVGLFS